MPKLTGKIGEILKLFDEWNDALQSGDPDRIVEKYAANAILLPTLSPVVRHNHSEIRNYFQKVILPQKPSGTIIKYNVRLYGDIAINSGVYAFTLTSHPEPLPARYTFVYKWFGNRWLIVEHHSSLMPEDKKASPKGRAAAGVKDWGTKRKRTS